MIFTQYQDRKYESLVDNDALRRTILQMVPKNVPTEMVIIGKEYQTFKKSAENTLPAVRVREYDHKNFT